MQTTLNILLNISGVNMKNHQKRILFCTIFFLGIANLEATRGAVAAALQESRITRFDAILAQTEKDLENLCQQRTRIIVLSKPGKRFQELRRLNEQIDALENSIRKTIEARREQETCVDCIKAIWKLYWTDV